MDVSGRISNSGASACSTAEVWHSTSTRPSSRLTVSAASTIVCVDSTSSRTTVNRSECLESNSVSPEAFAGSRHVATTCPPAARGRPGMLASGTSRS